jgi:hypothetical protein
VAAEFPVPVANVLVDIWRIRCRRYGNNVVNHQLSINKGSIGKPGEEFEE